MSSDEKVRDLTDDEVTALRNYIDSNLQVEGDLRRERSQAIKRLGEIGAYRGIRHRRALPVNGQRTKTNGRTRKGPKKTVGRRKEGEDLMECSPLARPAHSPGCCNARPRGVLSRARSLRLRTLTCVLATPAFRSRRARVSSRR